MMKVIRFGLLCGMGILLISWSVSAQSLSELKERALDSVQSEKELIHQVAEQVWQYSETALKERETAEYLTRLLKDRGFRVQVGVAGMPTAFVAEYGEGDPTIGVLAEFDALPGVGNAPVPEKAPREDGVTSGQGCGHNLFAAASVGGAVALKELIAQGVIRGTLKLFGTPAEETVVGKVYMVKEGVFDGLDAVIDWHPDTETGVRNQPGRALNNFEVEFFGQAAHASADPWNGRSALDAVELMNHGVNMLREHIQPTARIHYVIPHAGEAPNVVPEYAKVWYFVRDVNREAVERHYEKILKIAEGAALATGTNHEVKLITGVHEYLLNRPLQEALQANLELVGPVPFDEVDQTFARRLQRELNLEEKGFLSEIRPLAAEPEPVSGGSTDVAEVSWITPTAGFRMTTAAADVPWHSWATTACHGTPAARKAAVTAARVIAVTGVDFFTREELLEKAWESFREATEGKPYESPVPAEQSAPLPEGS